MCALVGQRGLPLLAHARSSNTFTPKHARPRLHACVEGKQHRRASTFTPVQAHAHCHASTDTCVSLCTLAPEQILAELLLRARHCVGEIAGREQSCYPLGDVLEGARACRDTQAPWSHPIGPGSQAFIIGQVQSGARCTRRPWEHQPPDEHLHTTCLLSGRSHRAQPGSWQEVTGVQETVFSTFCVLKGPEPPSTHLKPDHDPSDKCHVHLQTYAHPHVCTHVCKPPIAPAFSRPPAPSRASAAKSRTSSPSPLLHPREPCPRATQIFQEAAHREEGQQ